MPAAELVFAPVPLLLVDPSAAAAIPGLPWVESPSDEWERHVQGGGNAAYVVLAQGEVGTGHGEGGASERVGFSALLGGGVTNQGIDV